MLQVTITISNMFVLARADNIWKADVCLAFKNMCYDVHILMRFGMLATLPWTPLRHQAKKPYYKRVAKRIISIETN